MAMHPGRLRAFSTTTVHEKKKKQNRTDLPQTPCRCARQSQPSVLCLRWHRHATPCGPRRTKSRVAAHNLIGRRFYRFYRFCRFYHFYRFYQYIYWVEKLFKGFLDLIFGGWVTKNLWQTNFASQYIYEGCSLKMDARFIRHCRPGGIY